MSNEKVFYCKDCLSLRVMNCAGIDYCDECTSANIGCIGFNEWESKYKEFYGKKYIETKEEKEERLYGKRK